MKKLLLFCGIFLALQTTQAQNFYGLSNSNWAGINAIYINPANIADARHRQHFNLINFGNQFNNDYATLELPFPFRKLLTNNVPDQYKNPDGSLKWDNNWIVENLNGKPKNFNFYSELRGPGFMTRIGKNNAIAIATRTRWGLTLNNVSEDFIRFIRSQSDSLSFANADSIIKDNRFDLNLNAYQEVSASFARVLLNKDAFYLKVGGSVKVLMGIGSAYIKNQGIDFEQRTNDTLVINSSNVQVGHSNPAFIEQLQNGNIGALFPTSDIRGAGVGFDIGGTFEWRPEGTEKLASKNKYLLRVGMSLLDIGRIKYTNRVSTYSAGNTNPVVFTADSAFNAAFDKGIDSGLAYLEEYARQNFNYRKGSSNYTATIPSTLNLQVDWNIFKMFYLGLNWTQSFVNKDDVGFRRPSSIVLLPRIETKLVEFSIPVSVFNDYKDFGLGAFLRVGPVFIGSDNLIQSVNRSSLSGFDFYFGISTGIPATKTKKKSKTKGIEG